MLLRDKRQCIINMLLKWTHGVNDHRGSITLEAALVMPFFVAFILVMIALVKVAMLQMALQGAVNETVKQLATHAYPAYVMQADLIDKIGATDSGKAFLENVDSAGQAWNDLKGFESNLQDWGVNLNITGPVEETIKQFVQAISCAAAEVVVETYAGSSVLNPDNLTVSRVAFNNELLGIEAQYQYKMVVPFFKPDIVLRAQATEKLWNQFTDYDQTPKPQKQINFIGSVERRKYHISGNAGCIGVQSIKEPNLIGWSTEEEAMQDGYVRCKICWPD